MEINIKPCKISTSFKTEKIYPELEDLEVTPSSVEQQFKSKKYGFDNVTVKAGSGGIDTSDATATAGDIRKGKTAYVNGQKITGTFELPYIELAYAENTDANQYINTGVSASSTVGVELEVQTTNTETIAFFGAYNVKGLLFGQHNGYHKPEDKGYYVATTGTWTYSGVPFDNTQFHKFVYDPMNNKTTVDGVTVNVGKHTGISEPLCLFRAYEWQEKGTGVRISSCKIYNNGTLIKDYIPVKRNSDGVICMYDLIEGKYFLPSSGTFIAGPEI